MTKEEFEAEAARSRQRQEDERQRREQDAAWERHSNGQGPSPERW